MIETTLLIIVVALLLILAVFSKLLLCVIKILLLSVAVTMGIFLGLWLLLQLPFGIGEIAGSFIKEVGNFLINVST